METLNMIKIFVTFLLGISQVNNPLISAMIKIAALFVILLTVAIAGYGIPGCTVAEPRTPVLLIILLDETESYMKTGNWTQSLRTALRAVDFLRPGDAVCVIGIDDHGFDQDDVLIPAMPIPRTTLKSVEAKRLLMDRIASMEPREESSGRKLPEGGYKGFPFGTDTRGAVSQAAQISGYFDDHLIRILIFTDFRDEPPVVPEGRGNIDIQFTGDCRLKALYIDETGGADWFDRIERWVEVFNNLGVKCSAKDFYPTSMSSPSTFPKLLQDFFQEP